MRRVCVYKLILILILPVIFLLLLFTSLSKWPYSRFFIKPPFEKNKQLLEEINKKNTIKYDAAKSYFDSLDAHLSLSHYEKMSSAGDVEIIICVITTPRHPPPSLFQTKPRLGYLTQVTAAFNQQILTSFKGRVSLLICNTHWPSPHEHHEATFLSSYFPILDRVSSRNYEDISHASSDRQLDGRYDKERADYVFCLHAAMAHTPNVDHILMVQDDAVPLPNMLTTLDYLLHLHLNNLATMIKLYYPERWLGYSWDALSVSELVGLALMGTSLTLLLYYCYSPLSSPTLARILLSLLFGSLLPVTAWVVGRPHLLTLKQPFSSLYTLTPAPHCCLPAELYEYEQASHLAKYLTNVTCSKETPLDIVIDQYAEKFAVKQQLVQPNMFTHIGIFSTLGDSYKEPTEFL